tara:strand:+ start:164 stop:490 length:327 start_codon:yes stop_codon:yes gene_type:complete
MAKQKKASMKPADAVKVLANEANQTKQIINQITQDSMQTRAFLTEVGTVLEQYIVFKGDKEGFTKHMEDLAKERNNDNQANEQADGRDTDGDIQDETVGTEGVRSQEG